MQKQGNKKVLAVVSDLFFSVKINDAAKRAGMRCVAIPNSITARLDLSHADLVLPSLAEVTTDQLLERFSETS